MDDGPAPTPYIYPLQSLLSTVRPAPAPAPQVLPAFPPPCGDLAASLKREIAAKRAATGSPSEGAFATPVGDSSGSRTLSDNSGRGFSGKTASATYPSTSNLSFSRDGFISLGKVPSLSDVTATPPPAASDALEDHPQSQSVSLHVRLPPAPTEGNLETASSMQPGGFGPSAGSGSPSDAANEPSNKVSGSPGMAQGPPVTARLKYVQDINGHHHVIGREGTLTRCEDEVSSIPIRRNR